MGKQLSSIFGHYLQQNFAAVLAILHNWRVWIKFETSFDQNDYILGFQPYFKDSCTHILMK